MQQTVIIANGVYKQKHIELVLTNGEIKKIKWELNKHEWQFLNFTIILFNILSYGENFFVGTSLYNGIYLYILKYLNLANHSEES